MSFRDRSDRGDNTFEFFSNGIGDILKRCVTNLRHRYRRVDGSNFDFSASEILHDHIARQHRSDLVILHRCFDIDFGQHAKALSFECLDDAFDRSGEAPLHNLGDVIFHWYLIIAGSPEVPKRPERD